MNLYVFRKMESAVEKNETKNIEKGGGQGKDGICSCCPLSNKNKSLTWFFFVSKYSKFSCKNPWVMLSYIYKMKILYKIYHISLKVMLNCMGIKTSHGFLYPEKGHTICMPFFDIHPVNDILNFTILKTENIILSSVHFPEIIPYQISAIIQKEKSKKAEKLFLKRRIYGRGNFIW